ncbi:hypothetical protein G7092_20060 [Mucilaginibacter sp. HC2]|nr:hypothetical protein [Mucilaginibacter inviolabilis]
MLLIAFLLNLFNKLSAESKVYKLMNFIGAGTCCYASYMVNFYPFVVLEDVWGFVALISLLKVPRGTSV